MRAVCWRGKDRVEVATFLDPTILNPNDSIVRISLTAICGSDLHIYGGYIPTMEEGDVLGHEFMGEVIETGSSVRNLKKGDRVVVPFAIACGQCYFCRRGETSLCDNTNPNAWMADALYVNRAPACLGTPISMGVIGAVRPNMYVYRFPISVL